MDGKRKIVVLGANAGQADLIRHMKTRGWHVVCCAHRTGEPGALIADEFHQLDIRDIDAVVDLATKVEADLVYSISSDVAAESAVLVSERMGLPHFFNTNFIDLLNKKEKLRDHLNAVELSVVPYVLASDQNALANWTVFPCMVKPSDAQGQRGVVKTDDRKAMDAAIKEAFQFSDTVIVEQYLDGVEMSCNVLVDDGRIIFDVLSERLVHEGHLAGIPQGHLVPCANVPDDVQKQAIDLVHAVVKSLNVGSGCLYFQMKATSNGVKLIEIAPRLDGCHMWRLIKEATDRDFLQETIDVLLGETHRTDVATRKDGQNRELIFQQTPPSNLFQLAKFPIPSDKLYHEYRYEDGQEITPINGKLEVVGYFVRAYDDHYTEYAAQNENVG